MVLPLQQCLFLSLPHFIPSRRQSAFCTLPKKVMCSIEKVNFFFTQEPVLRLKVAMKALPLSNAAKTLSKWVRDKVWDIIATCFWRPCWETRTVPVHKHLVLNIINSGIPSESSGAPPESSCPPPLVPSACSETPPLYGGTRSSPPRWGEQWGAGLGWFVFPVLLLSSLLPLKDTFEVQHILLW